MSGGLGLHEAFRDRHGDTNSRRQYIKRGSLYFLTHEQIDIDCIQRVQHDACSKDGGDESTIVYGTWWNMEAHGHSEEIEEKVKSRERMVDQWSREYETNVGLVTESMHQ